MGEVYLAHDMQLNRRVALKLLPSAFSHDKGRLNRFIQEARAASALNHPNILTIYEVGRADSTHFIATEFVDGQTLRRRMMSGRIRLTEAIDIASQVAFALTAAHEAGIVHRDIKPENIMLRRDRVVKVLDFGLAKLIQPVASSVDTEASTQALFHTDAGVVMGTIAYMSPEQARGLEVDARTDIWSLGVVLYEMLAGCLPFTGETKSDLIVSILGTEPQPLASYAPDAPAELVRIVRKALRKDREERYQGVKDLLLDLKSLRRQLEIAAEIESSAPPAQTKQAASKGVSQSDDETVLDAAVETETAARARPTTRSLILAAVSLLALTAALVWFVYSHRNVQAGVDSVAVLPFVNASGDAEMEYLSDGMTESLINSLSLLPHLTVKARASVFRYKGKDVDPQTAGRELGVEAILTGRVAQHADDLTISLELVDARTGNHLWGEQYERPMSALTVMQSEITRDVSEKLRARLSGADQQRVLKPATENALAYQLYLKGRFFLLKRTEDGNKKALDYFNQALELDPNDALAYVGLADYYEAVSSLFMPPTEALPKMRAAAQRAVTLDDASAEAHAVLGQTLMLDWDWPNAARELKRAIELNPNSPRARNLYSTYLSFMGRYDEAIAERRRALELDPLSVNTSNNLGAAFFWARRYDEAIAQLRQTIEMDQSFWLAYMYLGKADLQKGDLTNGLATLQQARNLNENPFTLANLGYAYAITGKREEARQILATLLGREKERSIFPTGPAFVYAGLGDKEETLVWLQKIVDERTDDAPWLRLFPELDSLHSDPRFQELVRRVGLTL